MANELESNMDLVASGNTLQKVQSGFTTAVAVQKPRDRQEVIKACEEEAAIAGEEFYYSWTVKGKQGPKLVEGLSYQAAMAAARNWCNCAVPTEVEEFPDRFVFKATFVDFETGFNLQRVFRQRKSPDIGMKDRDRAEDITFQIGQSKAQRNSVLAALPSWLTSKMLSKAKENVIEKINKMGIAKAREASISYFEKRGVEKDRIELKLGKKSEAWNAEDIARLQGAMGALRDGMESEASLFPNIKTEDAAKVETLNEKVAQKAGKEKEAAPSAEAAKTETVKTVADDGTVSVRVKISNVGTQENKADGTKMKSPKYNITDDSTVRYSTFDKKIKEEAEEAMGIKEYVDITYNDDNYKSIVSLNICEGGA